MPSEAAMKQAREIAADLFTRGDGAKGEHLRLFDTYEDTGKHMSGWSEVGMADFIALALDACTPEPKSDPDPSCPIHVHHLPDERCICTPRPVAGDEETAREALKDWNGAPWSAYDHNLLVKCVAFALAAARRVKPGHVRNTGNPRIDLYNNESVSIRASGKEVVLEWEYDGKTYELAREYLDTPFSHSVNIDVRKRDIEAAARAKEQA